MRILVLVVLVMTLAFAAGCEFAAPRIPAPTPEDPQRQLTAQEYRLDVEAQAARRQREDAAKIQAEEARIRQAKVAAMAEAADVAAQAEISAVEARAALQRIKARAEVDVAAAEARIAAIDTEYSAWAEALGTEAEARLAEAERQRAARQGLLSAVLNNPVVSTFAASAGVNTQTLAPGLGEAIFGAGVAGAPLLIANILQRRRSRRTQEALTQKADSLWDEAVEKTSDQYKALIAASNAAWDGAAAAAQGEQLRTILAMLNPAALPAAVAVAATPIPPAPAPAAKPV